MNWRTNPLADNPDSRHADSDWPSEPVSAWKPSDGYREPRARFAGAILLLWVVAFAAVCLVWEVLT